MGVYVQIPWEISEEMSLELSEGKYFEIRVKVISLRFWLNLALASKEMTHRFADKWTV